MGGKKKTKWRKIPLEELSHMTIKRNSNEELQYKDRSQRDHCLMPTSETWANSGQQYDGTEFRSSLCSNSAEPEANGDCCSETIEGNNCGPQPGFYINGLWLPLSEVEGNLADSTTFPVNIIDSVPLIMNLPSTYCPSVCPSYSTIHSPDVTYNPNAFVLPSDPHIYRSARKESFELSKEYEANVSFKMMDTLNVTACSESSGHSYLLSHNNVLLRTAKTADITNSGDFQVASFLDGADCEMVAESYPYGASEVVLPIYQHPSCSFGQTLYSIPLHQALSPTYPTPVIYSWPATHFQRRRKKRKGYAEYAIIPQKNATSSSLNENVKKSITNPDKPYSKPSPTTKQPSEADTAVSTDLQNKEINDTMIKEELQANMVMKNHGSVNNELSSYTADLVENILLKAKEELRFNTQLHDEEKHLVDKENADKSYPEKLSVNMKKRVVEDDEIKSYKRIEENHDELKPLVPIKQSILSNLSNATLYEDTNQNIKTDTSKSIKENYNLNMCEPKNNLHEHKIQFDSVEARGDTTNTTKHAAIDTHSVCETVNNAQASHIADVHKAADVGKNMQEQNKSNTPSNEDFINSISFNESHTISADKLNETDSLQNSQDITHNMGSNTYDSVSKIDKRNTNNILESTMPENEKHTPHKYHPSHCSYMTHMNSDTFFHETEIELDKLHQLTSKSELQKQSIYKLAYDENIADQPELEDRDTITDFTSDTKENLNFDHVISSKGSRSEILVHEVDSASDAGSEDVELLPHRYESESVQPNSKHIYVNNLSLAVELLRTRESLPYDDEFKPIVGDDSEQHVNQNENMLSKTTSHKTHQSTDNHSFISDPNHDAQTECLIKDGNHERKNYDIRPVFLKNIINKPKQWKSRISDRGIQLEVLEDKEKKESKVESHSNSREKMDRNNVSAAQVRQRQQFHILASRTGIVNPCLCCVIV